MDKSVKNYLILLLVSLICYPLIFTSVIICLAYQSIICTYLKIKYKDKFGGMFPSADAVWTVEDISRTIVSFPVIVETQSKNPDDVKKSIRNFIDNKVFKNPEVFPKLTCIRSTFMGYSFFEKNEYTVDECVKSLEYNTEKKEIDLKILMRAMSHHSNLPLPRSHKALWEILVSSKPIRLHATKENTYHYPVLIRLSHILGDGISMLTLCKQNFSVAHYQNRQSHNNEEKYNLFQILLGIIKHLPTILIAPAVVLYEYHLRTPVRDELHGKPLSGKKILVANLETEKKLIQMIKKIKDTVPDVRFTDVLYAAISDSFAQYYKKKSYKVPEKILPCMSLVMEEPSLDQRTTIENNFSAGFMEMPILVEPDTDKIKRLEVVTKEANIMRESYLVQINYWLLRWMCGISPQFLLRIFLNSDVLTMFFTNLPGIQSKMYMFDGYEVKDMFACLPQRGKNGIGICIMTHGGRLQVTLQVDKILIPTEEDAQFIVDNIANSIVSMYERIK